MHTFIETKLFSRLVSEYLSDEEYANLQHELVRNPKLGAVVRGTGGVRKARWAAEGQGKRGGLRVLYFVRQADDVIWMLTMYPKNVADSIPAAVLRKIKESLEE